MIGSRAVGLLRSITRKPISQKSLTPVRQQIRQKSHASNEDEWVYRVDKEAPAWSKRGGIILASFCWWWIYWNLYHGWPHIIGLYDGEFLPDPRESYTDEELGIPPDDVE